MSTIHARPLSLGIISFVRDFNPFVVLLVHTVEFLKLYEETGLRNWKNRSEGKKSKKIRSLEHVYMRIRKENPKVWKKIGKFFAQCGVTWFERGF